MKAIYKLAVMMVAVVALPELSATVHASKYSRTESQDSAGAETGTFVNNHHKSLAEETPAGRPYFDGEAINGCL